MIDRNDDAVPWRMIGKKKAPFYYLITTIVFCDVFDENENNTKNTPQTNFWFRSQMILNLDKVATIAHFFFIPFSIWSSLLYLLFGANYGLFSNDEKSQIYYIYCFVERTRCRFIIHILCYVQWFFVFFFLIQSYETYFHIYYHYNILIIIARWPTVWF